MIFSKIKFPIYFTIVMLILLVCSSCSYIESDDTAPAFLHIGSPQLVTNAGEGYPSHKIEEVYVFVGPDQLGIFKLPAKVPVIPTSKETEIIISAGVKPNGFKNNSVSYPFFNQKSTFSQINPNNTITLDSVFSYRPNVKFDFIEDFEGVSKLNVDLDQNPETAIVKTQTDKVGGLFAGEISLSAEKRRFEATTSQFFLNSDNLGGPVYLEFDYKTDVTIQIGYELESVQGEKLASYEFFYVPNDEWNRVYVDLSRIISSNLVKSYRVLFRADYEPGKANPKVLLDNIKLVHF